MHHPDRKPPSNRWSFLIGPLLVVLITVGFWWKLVLSNEFTYLNSPDLARQVLPWYQFEASEWHHGRIPLWDPNQWFGQPLIGQTQPGVVYPLNWLLFLAPLKNGWINQKSLHWYFVIIHLMAALFAYWLCRDLGCGRGASLVGSTLFAEGGFVGTNGWPQMLNGAVWAPLVLLFLFRAVRGKRPWSSAALCGFSLGLAWLSGHHQTPTFISLATAGVFLFFIFREKSFNRRIAALAGVAMVLTALVASLQLLPSQEYGKLAIRWVGMPTPVDWKTKVGYSVHTKFGFDPLAILGLVVPGWHDYSSGFVGVVGLALALLGMGANWRRLSVRVLTFMGLGGLLFALANYDVLQGILYAVVPLVDKARAPSMAIVVFDCAAAALAAWGVDSLLRADADQLRRRAQFAVGAFASLLFAGILYIQLFKGFPSNGDARPVVTMLVAVLFVGLLAWCRRGGLRVGVLATLAVLLVMIELGNESTFPYRSRYEENYEDFLKPNSQNADIVAFLRQQPGFFRIEVNHDAYAPNFGDFEGIQETAGYLASLTENLRNQDVFRMEFLRLAGVRYSLSPTSRHEGLREVFAGASGLKVYDIPDAYPRAFVVSKAEKLDDPHQGAVWLTRPGFDPRTETYVTTQAPKLDGCADPGAARVLRYNSGSIRIFADARCKSMVVLSDLFYPGWKATVDGKDATIYDAYAIFRGVVVGPGGHFVEFHYRPRSVLVGAVSAAGGLALVIFLCVWERRRTAAPGVPLLEELPE